MSNEETQPYDRSSKWLIQHHGDSLLRLAGIGRIAKFRPAQAEIVQPRQLPDGLLNVRLVGESVDDAVLLEVATNPERRVTSQVTRNMLLVYLDRGELPEVVVVVLHPKGKYRIPRRRRLESRQGMSTCQLTWRVVELWNVPAEDLLQAGDVGLVPWVLLAQSTETPEHLARRCREAIDRNAPANEHDNLLAVTQVLARLRYDSREVFSILGGKQAMIKSPLINEIVAERVHECILDVLRERFDEIPVELETRLRKVPDGPALRLLNRAAANCKDLAEFSKLLRKRR